MCVWGSGGHNSVLAVQARWDLSYGGHLVLSSHSISLLVQVPRRVCVIGRWSELRVDRVCQEHEVMRGADANETSGELGSAFGGTLVGLSQLSWKLRIL